MGPKAEETKKEEFGPGPEAEECKACHVNPGGTIAIDDDGKCLSCGRQISLEEVAAECAPTETITITEPLKVYLSDAEYKELAIKMGQFSAEINQADADLTAVKSRYKSRKEAAEAKYSEVANIIRSGWEERPVECHLIKDYGAGTITKIRLDTGEEVSTRPMTQEERQRGLAFMEQAEVWGVRMQDGKMILMGVKKEAEGLKERLPGIMSRVKEKLEEQFPGATVIIGTPPGLVE